MGSILQLLSEDISTIDGASNMVDGDFTQMDTLMDCIGKKVDIFHATGSSGLTPINTTLVVIMNWGGDHVVSKTNIPTMVVNGQNLFSTSLAHSSVACTSASQEE